VEARNGHGEWMRAKCKSARKKHPPGARTRNTFSNRAASIQLEFGPGECGAESGSIKKFVREEVTGEENQGGGGGRGTTQ